jgi:hypothetical protein
VDRRVGGDEHDVAGRVAGSEIGDDALRHEDGAEEIRREDAFVQFVFHHVQRTGRGGTRVVDEDVDRPERGRGGREERVDRRRLAHVERVCVRGTARIGDERGGLLELVDPSRTERDRPTERTECLRDGAADSRPRTGDHGDAFVAGATRPGVSQSTHRR